MLRCGRAGRRPVRAAPVAKPHRRCNRTRACLSSQRGSRRPMTQIGSALQNFLLALSALFSIVNPIGCGADLQPGDGGPLPCRAARPGPPGRALLGHRHAGVAVGRRLCAELLRRHPRGPAHRGRPGGGGAGLEHAVGRRGPRGAQAGTGRARRAGAADVAFFPLTMPFTTGPGTISVAIALGSSLPPGSPQMLPFILGAVGGGPGRGRHGVDRL